METYTLKKGDDLKLPDFVEVVREVTDEPSFSMFNLSMKEQYSHLKLLSKDFTDLSVDYPDEREVSSIQKISANSPSDLKSNGDIFTYNNNNNDGSIKNERIQNGVESIQNGVDNENEAGNNISTAMVNGVA